MKNILAVSLFLFLFTFAVFPQNNSNTDKQKELSIQLSSLLQAGKLDEAVEIGEKIVKLEKDANSSNSISYANALLNLARMKRDVYLILMNNIRNRKIEAREMEAASIKAKANAKEADDLYHQALQLNERDGRGETAQTADIKSELGILIYRYVGSRQGVDDSEKLLLESLALNEKVRGKDTDETLFVVLKTGDLYNDADNYEKALPYYERYIQTNEKTHGKDYVNLVNALQPYANIMFATFQEDVANETVKRIAELTHKSQESLKANLQLELRSKESVAFGTKASAAYRESLAIYQARRKYSSEGAGIPPSMAIIPVNVVVDENGKIIEAVAVPRDKDKNLKEKGEQEILKWHVRPFTYNGTARKLRGILYYREIN